MIIYELEIHLSQKRIKCLLKLSANQISHRNRGANSHHTASIYKETSSPS